MQLKNFAARDYLCCHFTHYAVYVFILVFNIPPNQKMLMDNRNNWIKNTSE